MGDGAWNEDAAPVAIRDAKRAYVMALKTTVILAEITAQLEAVADGRSPSREALAGIRRGLDDLRRDNEAGLAALARAIHHG